MYSRTSTSFVFIAMLLALMSSRSSFSEALDLAKFVAIQANEPITGVTTTPSGQVFVLFPHLDGVDGIRIAELMPDKSFRAFPNQSWNKWNSGMDPNQHFIGPNSLRIGKDGLLWVVDTGTRGFGTRVITGGPKLIGFDPVSGVVRHRYSLEAAVKPNSYVDDVRFAGENAILTDASDPGLIIINLRTGSLRRVLDHTPYTTASGPMHASGSVLKSGGHPVTIHADQLEISSDQRWLYFQPACGPLYRVQLRDLLDIKLSPQTLMKRVNRFTITPFTGGTAMTTSGVILVSDVDKHKLIAIYPNGTQTTLLEDVRLQWIDAMWIDEENNVWMPAAQLDQLALFKNGKSEVKQPISVYRVPLSSFGTRLP